MRLIGGGQGGCLVRVLHWIDVDSVLLYLQRLVSIHRPKFTKPAGMSRSHNIGSASTVTNHPSTCVEAPSRAGMKMRMGFRPRAGVRIRRMSRNGRPFRAGQHLKLAPGGGDGGSGCWQLTCQMERSLSAHRPDMLPIDMD